MNTKMSNENETIEQLCKEMMACHSPEVYSEEVRNYGYRVSAAHKRELAAKDALIKKLADALEKIDDMCDGDMCKHFVDNNNCLSCKYLKDCQTGVAHNALKTHESEIAKAREDC